MERLETEANVHTIVFDFASVSYIDSTGIKYVKVLLQRGEGGREINYFNTGSIERVEHKRNPVTIC
jgi:hypothetical protein